MFLNTVRLLSGLVEAEQFNRINRALADRRRMDILERIAGQKEMACAMLTSESAVSQPTLSHHLKELSTAGLIKPRREAKFCFYRFDRSVWGEYLAEMRRRIPMRRRRG
jgi:ArsR family transcriptional regulator